MKITKKEIQRVIRTMDRTQIYRIARLSGVNVDCKHKVYNFILMNAPNKKLQKKALSITFKDDKIICNSTVYMPVTKAVRFAINQKKYGIIHTEYRKVLLTSQHFIYWCHPEYGHNDYNKSIAFPVTDKYIEISRKINKYLGYESN